MHIFIDEAGSFVFADSCKDPWSVVVAYAVADEKIKALKIILDELKEKLKIDTKCEIKIANFTKEYHSLYLDFIQKLCLLNGVLFLSVIHSLKLNEDKYKEIMRFDGVVLNENPFSKESHLQLYVQQRIQFDLINSALIGSKCYFSKTNPSQLSKISWEADKKGKLFENFHSQYIERYLSGEGYNYQYRFLKLPGYDFDPFYKSYSMTLGADSGFSVTRILKNFKFEDSKNSLGIQVADLLSSGIRRCLKGVWGDYEAKIARSIANLLISHPEILEVTDKNHVAKKQNKELFPITRSSVLYDDFYHSSLEIFMHNARKIEEIEPEIS